MTIMVAFFDDPDGIKEENRYYVKTDNHCHAVNTAKAAARAQGVDLARYSSLVSKPLDILKVQAI